MIGDAGKNASQVGFGIETIELGRLDQRVDGGGTLAALVGACEEVVLAAHATNLLADYHGIVQYRRFNDIAKKGNAPIATETLVRIAEFYKIEETIRGRSADERRAVRQEKSKPQVIALRDWLETQLSKVSAKSPIAEATRYGLPIHTGLQSDQYLESDSRHLGNPKPIQQW
jgi:hypothetical protein